MTITILRNTYPTTSSSAPNMSGTAGALVSVLDYCLVTNLGWTKEYSATNKAVYKQPSGSNQFYLDVDDTNAQNARIRGYETMTAVATGTGPFPTDAQVSGGLYIYKSSTADTTNRPWYFISNGKIFYLVISNGASRQLFAFGDFTSYKGSDVFNTLLIANSSSSQTGNLPGEQLGTFVSTITGHYAARSYTQIGGSVALNKVSDAYITGGSSSNYSMGSGGATYPQPIEGGLHVAPVWITESTSTGKRGHLPGLWAPGHNRPLSENDTYSGAGGSPLSSKGFEAINLGSTGQVHFETTDTWS